MLQPAQLASSIPGRRGRAGFTLLEVLVVLAIIGLIMSLIGPRVLGAFGTAKTKTAHIQIDGLDAAIDLFYLDVGRYPTVDEGLVALLQKPTDAPVWNGPYIKGAALPNDPWGHPYQYRVPGRQGPYEIVSLGPDGAGGTTLIAASNVPP